MLRIMKIRMTTIKVLCGLLLLNLSVFRMNAIEAQVAETSKTEVSATKKPLKKISGTVYRASDKMPIPGVRIAVFENTRYTALSDSIGHFYIMVPPQTDIIIATASDYNSVETALCGRTENIEIMMYSDVFEAEYQRASLFTNADMEENIENTNALSVDDEIELKLGASVRSIKRSGTPAMGAAMFINGLNSLNASAQPLFVLDGVIIENQSSKTPIHDGYYNNILSAIDIDDIESVTVMKNGTSIYGAKGGNGVILITTKRASSMATRIDVNASVSMDMPSIMPSMMDADNFRLYASDLLGRETNGNTSYTFLNDDPTKSYYQKYHNQTDWTDYIYRDAITQKYGVSVRGGDRVAMYNLSIGYANSQSLIQANDFQRLNIRFNTDISLIDKLDARLDIAFSNTKRHLFDDGTPEDFTSGTITSTSFLSLIKAPILSPYKFDSYGNITTLLEDADDYGTSLGSNESFANPLAINKYGTADNKNYQQYDMFTISFNPSYQFTKEFSVKSLFYTSFRDETEKYFSPMTGVPMFYLEGKGETYNHAMSQYIRETNLSIDIMADWKKQISGNNIAAKAGARFKNNTLKSSTLSGYNTGSDKMPNISGSLAFRDVDGDDDVWRNLAYYADAQWNYNGKYFVQATFCTETSSRFGMESDKGFGMFGVRWGLFPSLQTGWVVSSEEFMRNLPFINKLKITAGYDVSGNDDIDNYASRAYFQAFTYLGSATGLQIANIGNSSVSWETTKRAHVGLDLNILNNRMNLCANLYKDVTDNLITIKSLDDISGLDYYWSNDGSLQNTGYDLSMYAKVVNGKKFKWDLGFSVGHYQNKICALPDNESFITSIYGAEVLTEIGQPAGLFYGYQTDGVFSTSSQAAEAKLYQLSSTGAKEYFGAGDMIFTDVDHNGEINNKDKMVIGDPNPDLYGNINTGLYYKGWKLSAIFKYSYGNDVYNYQRSQIEGGKMLFNQSSALQNRWTGEGQETNIPKVSYGDPMGNSRFSDRWIEDGSYLKLKNVTLSYTVPVSNAWLQGITVYTTAENLYSFTNYLGSDPETSLSNSVLAQGIDRGLTASGRSFVFGIKINL